MKTSMKTILTTGLLGLALAACGGTSSEDEGQFLVHWTLPGGGACTADDAIRVTYTPDVGTDVFPCLNGSGEQQGLTGNLPLGSYTLTIELGSGGSAGVPFTPYENVPAITQPGDLEFDGDVQDVTATFTEGSTIDSFNISFSVDFGLDDDGASPNCTQTDVGGLGVNQQHVDLLDMAGGVCVGAISIVDGAGADVGDACAPAGTNSVCQERTTTQTLVGVPPGDYVIVINGYKSGSLTDACWTAQFAFDTADATQADITLGDLTVPFDETQAAAACQEKRTRLNIASR